MSVARAGVAPVCNARVGTPVAALNDTVRLRVAVIVRVPVRSQIGVVGAASILVIASGINVAALDKQSFPALSLTAPERIVNVTGTVGLVGVTLTVNVGLAAVLIEEMAPLVTKIPEFTKIFAASSVNVNEKSTELVFEIGALKLAIGGVGS